MQHGLLAFDGSDHAWEALYVAAYLVERWGMALEIATVAEEGVDPDLILDSAQEYLGKHDLAVTTTPLHGPAARTIYDHARGIGAGLEEKDATVGILG